jgi:hypothetical protein
MQLHRVTVEGHEYYLPSSQSLEELKGKIESLVRQGGGWIDMPNGSRNISILVSPGLRITAEVLEAPSGAPADEHAGSTETYPDL